MSKRVRGRRERVVLLDDIGRKMAATTQESDIGWLK